MIVPSFQLITTRSQQKRLLIRCLSTTRPLPSRRVHWLERFRDFPLNVKQVYRDILRVKDIHAASRTANNAWTKDCGITGKIPRRQQEQARQLLEDTRIFMPLILMWIPPIIGFLPIFLAIGAPRQVLSRQFLNEYEREAFAIWEMDQRLVHFPNLSDHVWTSLSLNRHRFEMPILGQDAAGPVWDLTALFDEFCTSDLIDCGDLPREHLTTLALATGYAQRFPPPIPRFIVGHSPKIWISRGVKLQARHIWRDDKLCIEEEYHIGGCEGMTDAEVREACLLRGLPVKGSHAEMRECMTNHLTMMEQLWENRPTARRQLLKLFALHLPVLRRQHTKKE